DTTLDEGCRDCASPALKGKNATITWDVQQWSGTYSGTATDTAVYLGNDLWRCTKTFFCGEHSFDVTVDFYCEEGVWRTNISDGSVNHDGDGQFSSLSHAFAEEPD